MGLASALYSSFGAPSAAPGSKPYGSRSLSIPMTSARVLFHSCLLDCMSTECTREVAARDLSAVLPQLKPHHCTYC